MVRGVLSLGGFLVGLVLVVGWNGGYVYRNECPRAGGTTEREWTFRWESVIPYIAYERSGCETHTATRLALDAVGLWKLDDDGTGAAREDHSGEYRREQVDAFVTGCVANGETRAFCQCAGEELTTRLAPEEFNQLAVAMREGAKTYDDLPEEIRGKVRDANIATERDCR